MALKETDLGNILFITGSPGEHKMDHIEPAQNAMKNGPGYRSVS